MDHEMVSERRRGEGAAMGSEDATPRDDFTPHGYLDNPFQSWKLNVSGVLRSRPPAGMGWWTPNYGSYGRNQRADRAHSHVGIEARGMRMLTPSEFGATGVVVGCDLHTKHRMRYVWTHPSGVRVAVTYFLAGEDALAGQVEVMRDEAAHVQAGPVRLWLALELAHNPATSRLWEHGVYSVLPGAADPETGPAGLLGICPEGNAWAAGAAGASGTALALAEARMDHSIWAEDAADAGDPVGAQRATLLLAYDLALEDGASCMLWGVLARGVGPDQTLAAWRAGLAAAPAALARLTTEDERFWSGAPVLTGDWPGHWRRGLVTDLETLRMVARPAVGVFGRRWDGMQIQAPRVVLAETALDALALAWADPAMASELLLGCFASAPRPNAPCMREDGSYNMIADDGAICGTGPEWGWPFAVVDALWRRTGDTAGLAALYPYLAAYLDWWLAARADAAGWLVHACSWESGQDVSARFGGQRTGGSDVRHLRPVDLQAAVAQGAARLAEWGATLERPEEEIGRWRAEAKRLAERARAMWRGAWFHDFDTRAGRWSEVRDPMQLAPLACGIATLEQTAALRAAFDALPTHGGAWPALVWPPVALTAREAALAAGLDAKAGEMAAEILDRAWRRMDARELEPDGAVPGVTREFWPEGGRDTSAGIEGYGWGALTVHFLMRYVLGLRERDANSFALVPALPGAWRRPGAVFAVGPVRYGGGLVRIEYRVPAESAEHAVDVALELAGLGGHWVVEDVATGRELARGGAGADGGARVEWRGAWLAGVVVRRVT